MDHARKLIWKFFKRWFTDSMSMKPGEAQPLGDGVQPSIARQTTTFKPTANNKLGTFCPSNLIQTVNFLF